MAEGRGGVIKKFLDHTTPSARTNEASRLFLDRAATPPPAEEGRPKAGVVWSKNPWTTPPVCTRKSTTLRYSHSK